MGAQQGVPSSIHYSPPISARRITGFKQRAARWNGAFLTDGVGLGKTFVGLMLTEYYAVKERKNVLIMATKTGQDTVWEPELQARLPDLTGCEFTNVRVMAHTDLSTQDALERSAQADGARGRRHHRRRTQLPESRPAGDR